MHVCKYGTYTACRYITYATNALITNPERVAGQTLRASVRRARFEASTYTASRRRYTRVTSLYVLDGTYRRYCLETAETRTRENAISCKKI